MKKYIFGERNGIYIINLEITLSCLKDACAFIQRTASEGKEVLFVGTKKQAQESLRENSERCGMPYVNQRWLGGMLTNFETVRKSVRRLEEIDQMEKDGSFQFVTKKEANVLKKEREKLLKNLSGVRNMKRLPAALFVIDSSNEEIAIKEARKLGIPVVAVIDTNSNPDVVNYPIPGNDDAIRAIKLFCESASGAVQLGRTQFAEKSATVESVKQAAEVVTAPVQEPPAEAAVDAAQKEAEAAPVKADELVVPDAAEPVEEKLAAKFVKTVEVEVPLVKKIKKIPRKEPGKLK